MPTPDDLHKLIDSLPEGAIEGAHRMLTNMQMWPPPPPPTAEEMRKRMEEQRMRMRRKMEERSPAQPGTISGFGGHGSYDPTTGFASNGMSYWEGDTFVAQTYRRHYGHELVVVERFRVEGQRLVYKHEVSGPRGKRDARDVTFDLP